MSMSLVPMTAGLPDFLKELGGYQDDGMSNGIAVRAPKISFTTDKKWTVTEEGATRILETVVEQNGNKFVVPQPSVNVVIVAASSTLTKAWYEKAYQPGSFEAPDCFSNDGKVPAPGVSKPQCSNCAACPKNAFGSHPTTGRGKACSDRKLVVVCWDGAPDKLMTFNVPTMSLNALRKIDADLRNANVPMQSVMMQLNFDNNANYPVVQISALGFVDKGTATRLMEAATSEEVTAMLREVDYDAPGAVPETVVPQNTIQFGGAQSAAEDGTTGSSAMAQGQSANSGGEAPAGTGQRRKRRTAAEMQAARQAEIDASNQPTQQTVQNVVQQTLVQEPTNAVPTQVELLQQQLAAALAAQGAPPSNVAQMVQREVVQEPVTQQTEVMQSTANVDTSSAPKTVLDLLAKWKS